MHFVSVWVISNLCADLCHIADQRGRGCRPRPARGRLLQPEGCGCEPTAQRWRSTHFRIGISRRTRPRRLSPPVPAAVQRRGSDGGRSPPARLVFPRLPAGGVQTWHFPQSEHDATKVNFVELKAWIFLLFTDFVSGCAGGALLLLVSNLSLLQVIKPCETGDSLRRRRAFVLMNVDFGTTGWMSLPDTIRR